MSPIRMGMFAVRVRIFSPDGRHFEDVDLIVDTGSVLTWIPKETAERLGLTPIRTRQFRGIDRGGIERPVGDAVIEYEGERGSVGIVFGEPTDTRVLGVTALERLGFEADPVAQTLRRLDAMPAVAELP